MDPEVKGQGQRSGSKVKVKVKGRGQRSRSKVGVGVKVAVCLHLHAVSSNISRAPEFRGIPGFTHNRRKHKIKGPCNISVVQLQGNIALFAVNFMGQFIDILWEGGLCVQKAVATGRRGLKMVTD